MESDEDDDIIKEFLIESYEGLDQLDRDLLLLEEEPETPDVVQSVFRTLHTIKGAAGFLALERLEGIAHRAENSLSLVRDGRARIDERMITALLSTVDALRQLLAGIEHHRREPEIDYSELERTLDSLCQESSDTQAMAQAISKGLTESPPTLAMSGTGISEQHVRVDVRLLDTLVNLVGELVLARNQILQCGPDDADDSSFLAASQRLNLITTELQENVMKTRMQPIGSVWSKFPRMVRDLARTCEKQVRVVLEGKDTELDKTIIEAIKDPLTHALRNAVDHGIESPGDRERVGKPPEGTLSLRAFHEGGKVKIEIADDGAGIDAEGVLRRALERGLLSNEVARTLSEHEIVELVFHPGFSTATAVTNVSGRGVGMDVVKSSIEKIGGSVDISTAPGEGTVLRIEIPLTLAIIPALMVRSGGERYAIPQVSLEELVRLEGRQIHDSIETVHDTELYRLRGQLLPLVRLAEELQVEPRGDADVMNLVILQADGRQFGLLVDEIGDTEEIVVKPLGKQLQGVPAFAGATILGDGKVSLILDVLGLAQSAGLRSADREDHSPPTSSPCAGNARQEPLLLCIVGESERLGIPLRMVERLEEIPRSAVERSGQLDVLQYRGHILPLYKLADVVGATPRQSTEDLQIVVHSCGDARFGFVVDCIVDVVDSPITQKSASKSPLGRAIVGGRVTDIIDLESLATRLASSNTDLDEQGHYV